jgi:DNA recombination protein RmuC
MNISKINEKWAFIVTLFLIGLAISLIINLGLLFVFQQTRTKAKTFARVAEKELDNLRQDLKQKDYLIYDQQQQLAKELSKSAALEERCARLPSLETLCQTQAKDIEDLKARQAELTASLDYERNQAAEKLKMLEVAQNRLSETFKSLSAEALSANNQSFLHLAHATLEKFQESAKTDLLQRQKAIGELLTPVQQALLKVDGKMLEMEKERVGAYEVLRRQVYDLIDTQKALRQETANLVKALRAPTVRGQWGEIQLKRVVEMAGMLSHCDFMEQVSTTTEEGRLRPDMIINLPGGKKIIVDAKAPLSAYLEALEASDEGIRNEKMMEHARQVRNHVRLLSQRAYWDQFQPTPEFVILFLPGETFFSAALEKDPSLIEVGVRERVILATPTTLIALLRAVAYGWRQESIAENARVISDLGREVYKRLSDLGSHITRLGRHLGQAVDSYNQTVGTLERRVLVTARKFKAIDSSQDDIEEVCLVEPTPRALQAIEMTTEEEDIPQKSVA